MACSGWGTLCVQGGAAERVSNAAEGCRGGASWPVDALSDGNETSHVLRDEPTSADSGTALVHRVLPQAAVPACKWRHPLSDGNMVKMSSRSTTEPGTIDRWQLHRPLLTVQTLSPEGSSNIQQHQHST